MTLKKIYFFITLCLCLDMTVYAQKEIVVAQDGSGNFKNIQDAVNSLPADAKSQRVIKIKKGIYKEKLLIDKSFITLLGEDPANTIITISLAREEWRCTSGEDYGTAAINLRGSDITLQNLSFINSYGKDNTTDKTIVCARDSNKTKVIKPYGHQMALRSFNTTRLKAINCIFTAYGGDTVSPWNTEDGMFYFKDCEMEGGVDLYCPRGWAYAENCKIISRNNNAAIWHDGSGHEESKTVLVNCRFVGDDNFKLGRYHRDAQFYLLNCSFAKNMADADIYLVPTENKIKWGRRVYYYDCHKDGGDYSWFKNNLPAGIDSKQIDINWTFDGKWNPLEKDNAAIELQPSQSLAMATNTASLSAATAITPAAQETDPIAENMLLYQRANGGWPKHFQGEKNVDYKRVLTDDEKKELQSGYEKGIDATIDNKATTKEIKYLAATYKRTRNQAYKSAAEKGIEYLLKAQYANGGWPQFYPDFSSYRSEITYNDDAMVNVLFVLYDIVHGEEDFDVLDKSYVKRCADAIDRGVQCILKTQIKQHGKLTAWCAQYDAKTLQPAMARKFELVSISGGESAGIVGFLMTVENPCSEIITAVNSAVEWFNKVKIVGYKFTEVPDAKQPRGFDKVLVADPNSTIWARFYDIDTNEPFFSGRDSQPKKTVAEIEYERRTGYAWYGTWPEKILTKGYPKWSARWNKKN